MSQEAVIERAVTFEIPLDLALPDLRPFVGRTVRLPRERFVTTYFDTIDDRLWRQGMMLRFRTSDTGGNGTWTLQVLAQAGDSGRERSYVSWVAPAGTAPTSAMDILQGVVRREPLRELPTLETTRQRMVLRDEHDQPVVELDDDLVHVVGGQRDGERFRQVELQLIDPGWNDHKIIRALERAGADPERVSHNALAIDLPERNISIAVDDRSQLGDAVQAVVRSDLDQLVAHDWRLRIASPRPSPGDIHQARVATRRLRSNLGAFGDILDPIWLGHVRTDLKWVGAALGGVRDADVLSDDLGDVLLPAFEQRLAVQRRAACQKLATVMVSVRYLDLLDKLDAGANRLPLAEGAACTAARAARDTLPTLVGAQWNAMLRKVHRAGSRPSAKQLHRIRIKAKHLRYAAEAATPVVGKPAKRTAKRAERIQTVLGRHHDAVAHEQWLKNAAAEIDPSHLSGIAALDVGILIADLRSQRRKARQKWVRAWETLAKSKSLRWMRKG
jgi:CHAD domain-containing protein